MENGFTRKDIIQKFRLESSANVQAVKKSLASKEFIETDGDRITISDPLFRIWIQRNIIK